MRMFLVAFVILAGVASAQQAGDAARNSPPESGGITKLVPTTLLRRLEAVTYDPQQGQLIWFISVWDLGSDMSKPADVERYVIHIDSDVMQRNGELRRFHVPATDLHELMSILSKYAIRSTIWWSREGAGADDSPGLAPDDTGKDKSKDHVEDDKSKRASVNKPVAPAQGSRGQ